MASATVSPGARSIAELTRAVFGAELTIDEAFARVGDITAVRTPPPAAELGLWVASVGYERHRDHHRFAEHLYAAGVRRVLDVRELPISRRRGFAKTALAEAMAGAGMEYVHIRALGNPKPLRDMYKAGKVAEGRAAYRRFLLSERRQALDELLVLLREKPSALMCLEHDPATCHRTVIVEALRSELGTALDLAELS